jgi:hypothetical protein
VIRATAAADGTITAVSLSVTTAFVAFLPDRGVVSVTGPDAEKLLQGLITNDMGLLTVQPAIHAALLTPQGKILFEFFVAKTANGYLLDVVRDKAADLTKRLNMYKLRASVDIRDMSSVHAVIALWNGTNVTPDSFFTDPRLPALGLRAIVPASAATDTIAASGFAEVTAGVYHAHRIALGVPEGGKDYAFGDTFPHEALLDRLHAVSFTKGCYVGQEIVARMEHRNTARKRIVPVVSDRDLPRPGTGILAGDIAIGTLGSTAGHRGLALLRLDRAAEFIEKGVAIRADSSEIRIEPPAFADFTLLKTASEPRS